MTPRELVAARKRLGLTQTQLAIAVGVSLPTISNWERGVHRIPPPAAKLIAEWARRGTIPARNHHMKGANP
jgi:DNA-binding transcriptional regulator YiaG